MRIGGPKTLVLFFATILIAAVTFLMLADIEWRRRLALAAADGRARNRAEITASYVSGRFDLLDAALRQLAIHGRRIGGAHGPADEWEPMLAAAQASLSGRGSVSILDAQGVIRHSTLKQVVGQTRRENYIFKVLSAQNADEMIVDAPFESQVQKGRIVIPAGRRLSAPDGSFDGLVVAVVLPDDFREFFGTVSATNRGVAMAFHPTGMLLVREPPGSMKDGDDLSAHPVLQASRRAASGVVHGPVDPNGEPYIIAFRTIARPPLTVALGLSEAEVLADWYAQRRSSFFALTGLSFTVLVFVLLLFRQMDALAASLTRETRAREEAEAASRMKDEFLMTLSHELRTPLNAIVGWTKMLTSGSLPSDARPHALATIDRNAQAQTRLVEELLDVSAAITGKLRIDARPLNIADPVHAAVETLRPAIVAKRLAFEAEVDPSLHPIVADPDRVQQIVWNLLSNAIKFTPSGGSVRLTVRRNGTSVEMVVIDNGVGIPPDFMPFVFDRFRQADAGPRREQGGLGLGLAIVRHLVELHGGTVTAASGGVGKGATFRVTLPEMPRDSSL